MTAGAWLEEAGLGLNQSYIQYVPLQFIPPKQLKGKSELYI